MPAPSTAAAGDFASAAMVRVLQQGLCDLGLAAPEADRAPREGAVVALDDKRSLLRHAIQRGGFECLALLGRGLRRFTHEPTHRALASARDANDMFDRWGRLERYIHSRHRVRLIAADDRHARLSHVALRPHPPPQPAEDLVVLGVLAAFLEACGHQQVRCTAGAALVYPSCDREQLSRAINDRRTHEWHIDWQRRTMPRETAAPAGAAPDNLAIDEHWSDWVKAQFNALSTRLMSPPDVDELALQNGMPRRTVQRELQRQGTGFRPLLAEARYRSAGWWLMQSPVALAEVGFLCGYSDQPHFTREFRRRSGLTPADYRRHFALRPASTAASP